MGKRSNFERNPRDYYVTPFEAVVPLIPHLKGVRHFHEPCAGDGSLIRHLESFNLVCHFASDIEPQALGIIEQDALKIEFCTSPAITNPPWRRDILHPMIDHFRTVAPFTWLLFDADWAHTKQARPFMRYCSDIVSVGRVKWIPGSKMTGKDNCCWYKFGRKPTKTLFHTQEDP